jgi:hypothetical protein
MANAARVTAAKAAPLMATVVPRAKAELRLPTDVLPARVVRPASAAVRRAKVAPPVGLLSAVVHPAKGARRSVNAVPHAKAA